MARLSLRVYAGFHGSGGMVRVRWDGSSYSSAGVQEGFAPLDAAGDHVGPGPVAGECQVAAASCLSGRLRRGCRRAGRRSDRRPPVRARPARPSAFQHRPCSPRRARPSGGASPSSNAGCIWREELHSGSRTPRPAREPRCLRLSNGALVLQPYRLSVNPPTSRPTRGQEQPRPEPRPCVFWANSPPTHMGT